MAYLKIPLELSDGHLSLFDEEKKSIDGFLEMFLNTAKWTVASDPEFGFDFVGLKFEIFDENSGTVFNSAGDGDTDSIYRKKISGSSRNIDTFASDLNDSLQIYEPRLRDTTTTMTYLRENRVILLQIKGEMVTTGRPYEYSTVIKVWS